MLRLISYRHILIKQCFYNASFLYYEFSIENTSWEINTQGFFFASRILQNNLTSLIENWHFIPHHQKKEQTESDTSKVTLGRHGSIT